MPVPTAASLTAGRKEKPTRILLLRDVELALLKKKERDSQQKHLHTEEINTFPYGCFKRDTAAGRSHVFERVRCVWRWGEMRVKLMWTNSVNMQRLLENKTAVDSSTVLLIMCECERESEREREGNRT